MTKLLGTLLMLALFSVSAHAERFILNYDGEVFRGQNTIRLKQELRQQFPNLRQVRRLNLDTVLLVSKSAAGRATTSLVVGDVESRTVRIPGNREDFRRDGGYSRIRFSAPGNDEGSRWILKMNGNVKINRIVIEADVERRRPGNGGNNPDNRVTRQCAYELEFIWGDDIRTFTATHTGRRGAGIQAIACQRARRACEAVRFPLTQCTEIR